MAELNNTQKKIYEFLAERSQGGVPPSVREIGKAVGLKSTSTVQAHLDALEKAMERVCSRDEIVEIIAVKKEIQNVK